MFNGFDGVGKTSTTGATTDGTSGSNDAQVGVGKSSRAHDLGVQSMTGKRDREPDDDGRGPGDGKGSDKRGRGVGGDDRGFRYHIVPGEVGSFAGDHSQPAHNTVVSTASGPAAAGTAYVGNVITIGDGKDKTPKKVAEQYAAEAFDTPGDAAKRFALVVGVNRRESVLQPAGQDAAELDAQLAEIQAFTGFPVTAFRKVWQPAWVDDDGAPATIDTVRAAAQRHVADAQAAERAKPSALPPVGPMRTAVLQLPATAQYTQALRAHFQNVYVHVGDADAINLKAKADAGAAPTGLFDRYDQVLGDARKDRKDPKLVSGGYRFRTDDKFLPEGQRPHDPHAGEAGKVTPQTAASTDFDMANRHAIAQHDPSGVYMPEPNMLIRHDAITEGSNFGESNRDESLALVKSMTPDGKKPKQDWARQNMVFDQRAALYTDGTRFDAEAASHPFYGAGGTDTAGLMHPDRNPQSHGRKRELGNAIAHMNRNVSDILDVYLPLQLLRAKDEKATGKVSADTLGRVREYLRTYETIVAGIDAALKQVSEDPEIKIPALTSATKKSNETRFKADPLKLNKQEQTGAQAIHANLSGDMAQFAEAAFPEQAELLSKKLVKAVAAAKAAEKEALQGVSNMLPICRSVALATAQFLSTFEPQAALLAQPQAAVQLPADQGAHGAHDPDAMQLDQPGML